MNEVQRNASNKLPISNVRGRKDPMGVNKFINSNIYILLTWNMIFVWIFSFTYLYTKQGAELEAPFPAI